MTEGGEQYFLETLQVAFSEKRQLATMFVRQVNCDTETPMKIMLLL